MAFELAVELAVRSLAVELWELVDLLILAELAELAVRFADELLAELLVELLVELLAELLVELLVELLAEQMMEQGIDANNKVFQENLSTYPITSY